MTQGINFLKPKPVGDFRFYYRARLFKVGSLVLLIVYCLVLAATVAFSINIGQTKKAVATETQIKKGKIEGLKKVESLQAILKQRLFSLAEFKKKDTVSYSGIFNEILGITESGVTINNVSLGAENLVVVEGSALNTSILSNFLDRLSGNESAFSQAILSSLTRQEDGSYSFTVNLKIDFHD